MDKQMKGLVFAIAFVVFLIALKFTVFTTSVGSEIIPGVTNKEYLIKIESNSTLGEYILSDSFALDVSGDKVNSNSDIYVTNETDGKSLYDECTNAFIGNGYEREHNEVYEKEGRFSGIYRNDTGKTLFHIYSSDDVEEHIGYYVILVVNRGRL